MEFAKVLQLVGKHLESEGADWVVVGGLALAAHGAGRMTADVDIATERSAQVALVDFLQAAGYETLHVSEGYSNHAHSDPAMGRLDVVYVDATTASDLLRGAAAFEIFAGVSVKVPRAEYLVAMKVLAAKNDPGRRLQEMADIVALLRATGLGADAVKAYFDRHELMDDWEQVRDSL